ncbi:DUF1682-domain-containing protein [Ramicandelaber brevisporus]|nr:DUF1682-domain-containing protein [Ramicandelaber brevisporus]
MVVWRPLSTAVGLLASAALISAQLDAEVVGQFEGPHAGKSSSSSSPKSRSSADFSGGFDFDKWMYEVIFGVAVFGYMAVYFIGSRRNASIADTWGSVLKGIFTEQFAYLGRGDDNEYAPFMIYDGASEYVFYGSGRRSVQYVFGQMRLLGRHDVIAVVNESFQKPGEKVIMEIKLSDELPASVTGFVFGIVPSKRAKSVRESRYDLQSFTRQITSDKIGSKFAVFSESGEVTQDVFNCPGLVNALNNDFALVEELIITDQPSVKPDNQKEDDVVEDGYRILATIRIPDAKTDESTKAFEDSVRATLALADHIVLGGMNMRSDVRNKLVKARDEERKRLDKLGDKDRRSQIEEARNLKKKAEQDRVSQLSPEEQRKWEEKERKKEQRKATQKRTKRA